MDYKEYLIKKQKTFDSVKNPMRKDFIKRLNEVIVAVGTGISQNPSKEISSETISNYILVTYILTKVAGKRYIDFLIQSGTFIYDPETEKFRFPDYVTFEEDVPNAQ